MRLPRRSLLLGGLLAASGAAMGIGPAASVPVAPMAAEAARNAVESTPATVRSGREIFMEFQAGLADPECAADASDRWRRHFAHVPHDLAGKPDDLLPLFGYVVDALRASHLPTEYALIPFVESGYRPGARSPSGPAGLWQFIAVTARNHKVAIRPGYDGRLSPVDSTRAAVRYLRTLHGMFAGDWRLAVMGYNAGEYRVFGALRNAGQRAMDAEPEKLAMPTITHAYVRKLQALSCLLVEAGQREEWLDAIDHVVPVLTEATLPANATRLDAWATRQGHDAALLRRFNPVFPEGRVARADRNLRVLVPARQEPATATAATAASPPVPADRPPATATALDISDAMAEAASDPLAAAPPPTRRLHTVVRGDSIWRIARRYRVSSAQLLARNGLSARSVLRPGTVLIIDEAATDSGSGGATHVAN